MNNSHSRGITSR